MRSRLDSRVLWVWAPQTKRSRIGLKCSVSKTKGAPYGAPKHVPLGDDDYTVKLLPHPHPPVAFGLPKVKPEPCIEEV